MKDCKKEINSLIKKWDFRDLGKTISCLNV